MWFMFWNRGIRKCVNSLLFLLVLEDFFSFLYYYGVDVKLNGENWV